jgi:methylated-DNA-[protein]-cysteine S-methyltransferase
VTCVVYEADGWGEGELWFDGPRLVWHELPQPRREQPRPEQTRRKRPGLSGPHPHPGGEAPRRPLEATIPAKRTRMGNRSASTAQHLVHRIQRFFAGERVGFGNVDLDLDGYTPFQLELTRVLRSIPRGEVVSYRELAAAAGYANAQRAAGTFCAHNRFPLIVPCHRVVAADGIGRYGALGIEYKRRLLELEGVAF